MILSITSQEPPLRAFQETSWSRQRMPFFITEQQLVQETSETSLKRGHKRCSNRFPGMKVPAPALGGFGSCPGSVCAVITQHSLQTPPQVRLQSGWVLKRWVSPDACSTDSSAPHSKSRSNRNPGCEVIPVPNGEIQTGEKK